MIETLYAYERCELNVGDTRDISGGVATMEQYRAAWEEDVFDNIDEGRGERPDNYPIDASFPFNQYIAEACPEATRRVVAKNDMTIGPSKVLLVNQGDKIKVATRYFYEEESPGATYSGLNFLVEEILVSMAAAGAGVLPVGEGTLFNLANGNTYIGNEIFQFLSTEMDTTDMTKPHGYLVWMAYDKNFHLDPRSSGALRVVDPNELGTLFSGEIPVEQSGYLHVYLTNGTASKVINFDNFYITTMEGQTRQINHYYPYGMRMRMGHGKKYNNLYTGKELQTGEHWDPSVSTGLEMYDFEARFFDPQLGRWMVPDPAEQFANPYLAMGNNPVMYVDPNGEFAWFVPVIFAAVQLGSDLIQNDFEMNIGEIGISFAMGAVQGTLAALGPAGITKAWIAAGSAVGSHINIPIYEGENFSLSVSPSLSAGTNGVRLGMNAIAGVRAGRASYSIGYSFGRNFSATGLGGNMAEAKWSSNVSSNLGWSGNGWGISMGNTTFGGNYPQTVANYGFSVGKFSASIQNDWGPTGDGADRWRTAAVGLSYQVNDDFAVTAGFSIWTGDSTGETENYITNKGNQRQRYVGESPSALRNGNLFGGINYRGNSYRAGYNSESIRSGIQNNYHSLIDSPHFKRMAYDGRFYSNFSTYNPFTIYPW